MLRRQRIPAEGAWAAGGLYLEAEQEYWDEMVQCRSLGPV